MCAHGFYEPKQCGNRKWNSTETSTSQTTDAVLEAIDKEQLTATVLLDMSKAFHSVDHGILLSKLQDIGLSPIAIKWFRSYLQSRYRVVKIHNAISAQLPMTCEVPHRSTLGPLIFNIYTNDLPSIPHHTSSQCYIDDSKLILNFKLQDQAKAIAKLNEDLRRIRVKVGYNTELAVMVYYFLSKDAAYFNTLQQFFWALTFGSTINFKGVLV